MTVGAGRDDADVQGVLDGRDDTGCEEILHERARFRCAQRQDAPAKTSFSQVFPTLMRLMPCVVADWSATVRGVSSSQDKTYVGATLPDVRHHLLLNVLGSDVDLSGEEERDVLLGGLEGSWETGLGGGRHLCERDGCKLSCPGVVRCAPARATLDPVAPTASGLRSAPSASPGVRASSDLQFARPFPARRSRAPESLRSGRHARPRGCQCG